MGGEDERTDVLRRRLSGLREMTFQLVSDCRDANPSDKRSDALIVALQTAANNLGTAEGALAPTATAVTGCQCPPAASATRGGDRGRLE